MFGFYTKKFWNFSVKFKYSQTLRNKIQTLLNFKKQNPNILEFRYVNLPINLQRKTIHNKLYDIDIVLIEVTLYSPENDNSKPLFHTWKQPKSNKCSLEFNKLKKWKN